MKLVFTDISGESGVITDEFDVDYTGRWESEITAYVQDVATQHTDTNGTVQVTAAFSQLVIELPHQFPVVEVKRDENRPPD